MAEHQKPIPLRDRLTPEQWATLLSPLNPDRVNVLDGNDYLEQWDVRRWLLRVFGPGGWDLEVADLTLLREHGEQQPNKKWRWWVSYRATVRLTVRDQWGCVLGTYDGTAADEKANQPGHGDAHHGAATSAESTALKRAALNLGDAFGLSLYSKGVAFDKRAGKSLPVVAWTAVRPPDVKAQDAAAEVDAVPVVEEEQPTKAEEPAPSVEAQQDAALAREAEGYAQLADQCRTTDDLTAIWTDAKKAGVLGVLLDPQRGHTSLNDYIGHVGKVLAADQQEANEQESADDAARDEATLL